VAGPTQNQALRVAMAQVDCVLGDVEENARRATERVAEARELGAHLIVFPELSLTGYAVGTVEHDVALRSDDPLLATLGEEAGDMDVVVGFVEEGPVHSHNSAAYLERGRTVHVQRKTYLPTYGRHEEHKHFSPGQALPTFDTRLARMALLICNDAWQLPLPYLAVHDGARLLIVPAASALDPGGGSDPGNDADWNDLLHLLARLLETYVVFVNRVGSEAGVDFWGGSRAFDPWGRVVAEAPRHEPALTVAELDLSAVRRRRREAALVKEGRLDLLSREFARVARQGPT
jgi:predicted amidohydrolase